TPWPSRMPIENTHQRARQTDATDSDQARKQAASAIDHASDTTANLSCGRQSKTYRMKAWTESQSSACSNSRTIGKRWNCQRSHATWTHEKPRSVHMMRKTISCQRSLV